MAQWNTGCCRWGVKGRARWALQSLCGGAPALCETLPAPSTSSRRGKGNRLSLNTNHSISISHTLKLAELARLVAGYTRRECPHQRKRWGGCPGLWGSTALPGCRHHGKSRPTTFLIPRATRAAPSKATAARSARPPPLPSAPAVSSRGRDAPRAGGRAQAGLEQRQGHIPIPECL